ncbi:MAG TPA: tetratricopeptide repeat protein [Abditibacterium sp.]|jgi:TolA-binding protein
MSRHFFNGLVGAGVVLVLFVLLRVVWSPDPAQSLFLRAQRLESAGQIAFALRHYELISQKHPESFYAPRALLRQGDLLASQGRESNSQPVLRTALDAYARLASTYPSDPLATEALLDAGELAAEDLRDRAAAKGFYQNLLDRSGSKSDAAATATVKMGRLAIEEGQGEAAKTLLQRVLRQWPNLSDRAAEAQFHLGVAYETLFKNREWATRAYEATLARYPASTWANDARGRLGLLVFSDAKRSRPARRVLIDVEPLPDDGPSDGSLWSALRPLLAAHGIEADAATLLGWSLTPFYAAFDPQNPARVVNPQFDAWDNVVANAGLRLTRKSGGKEAEALRDLRDEIDAARAPLVYFEEKGADGTPRGTWALCVGYDSERDEVMLQSRGARFDTLAVKSFAQFWKAKSSLGGVYTLISLVPRGPAARPAPSLTPTPEPTPKPGQTPQPSLSNPPAFVWELPRLSATQSERRTQKRAATWLLRPKSGGVLLNIEGLSALARELTRLAQPQPALSAVETAPILEPTPAAIAEATADGIEGAESPYVVETPAAPSEIEAPGALNPDEANRARALLRFFGAPARAWAAKRRDAAAWCDEAAARLKDPRLKGAAQNLRASAQALETAITLVPSNLSDPLGAGDRAQIGEVARQIERARAAERAAADALRGS